MGGTCGMYGREEGCVESLVEKIDGRRAFGETEGVDGKIILKWILKK
jgi:hypothetical protein